MSKYYSYCPYGGMKYFDTEEEAKRHAEISIEDNLAPDRGWSEEVDMISYGIVIGKAVESNHREDPEGEFDEIFDMVLRNYNK